MYELGKIFELLEKYEILVEGQDADPYDMRNKATQAGKTIFMGPFDDIEIALLALFHEIGHIAWGKGGTAGERPPFDEWPYDHYVEAMAWKVGLDLASECGIVFSEGALDWAGEQLETYFEDDHPERSPLEHLSHAVETAGLG